MTTLTLLTKIDNDNQLKQLVKALKLPLNGLKVEVKILGVVSNGWVQISLLGEDEGVATSYVIKEVGICPSNFGNVKNFSTLKGYIRNIGKNGGALSVDVGVFQPKTVYATVALRHLQDQLVDGRKIAIKKIAKLFGFCEGSSVSVKVNGLDEEKSRIDGELSSGQVSKYTVWGESLLDRLLVLGPSFHEIQAAIEHAKLYRDVIDVEPLGMFEHALACKLGTDAVGLIPKFGQILKDARFSVFNAKTVMKILK